MMGRNKNTHPESGLEVLGVEALGVEAVAEGVSVAGLCAAVWGGRVFLPGTNKERIGGGNRGKGLPWVVRGGGMEHMANSGGLFSR